jgi:N6-adenosine-specific RNA methylase IME4
MTAPVDHPSVTAQIAELEKQLGRGVAKPPVRPFQIVAADCPWRFGDSLPGPKRGADKHYETLTVEQLKTFALPPIGADALLFLWRVAAMPQEALDVCAAWGFEPKSEIVWIKKTVTGARHMGMGRYVRNEHETCIIATRGRGLDLIVDHGIRSTFEAPVARHSEKPDEFYELVRKLTTGRRCELFARRRRPGFWPFGDQVAERVAAE